MEGKECDIIETSLNVEKQNGLAGNWSRRLPSDSGVEVQGKYIVVIKNGVTTAVTAWIIHQKRNILKVFPLSFTTVNDAAITLRETFQVLFKEKGCVFFGKWLANVK